MSATVSSSPSRIVLVTGPSGAGRSTAIRILEDFGFEAIDNMPLSLLPRLFDGPAPERSLALGIDVRNRDFSTAALIEMIDAMAENAPGMVQLLYLDCSVDVLLRRFSETRRRHPLSPAEDAGVGLTREIDLLAPLRARAHVLVDTSRMTPHTLRAELDRWFADRGAQRLAVSIHSFSYKRGLPQNLDIVLDCRFLRNPYWEDGLRDLDGRDERVARYVQQDERFDEFRNKVAEMLLFLLPAYEAEGKSYLSVGFGCSGGQHRSVALAEDISRTLANEHWQVSIRHRELETRTAVNHVPGSASGQTDRSNQR